MPMLLSSLRSRICTAFPTMKLHRRLSSSSITVERPFDKVFKDSKLLNLVAAYWFVTDAVLQFCEEAKKFLRKARDGERILDEARSLDGISMNNILMRFESCFSDEEFLRDFIRKGENCCEQILYDLPWVIEEGLSFPTLCFLPKRIYALRRRYTMLSLVERDGLRLKMYSEIYLNLIPKMDRCMRRIKMRIKFGEAEKLEEEHENLKIDIKDLEQRTKALEEVAENGRIGVHEKIMEFLSDVSAKRE